MRATLNGGWFITGAELRCYGKPHTPLRQGRERAEHFGGWQRCGAGELCEPHLPLSMTLRAGEKAYCVCHSALGLSPPEMHVTL